MQLTASWFRFNGPRAVTSVPALYTILIARNVSFPEGFPRAAVWDGLIEERIRCRKICHMLQTIRDSFSKRLSGHQMQGQETWDCGFSLHPQWSVLCHLWQAVCNLRTSACHGTGGCLCPRTIHAELNQGETSPQQRQLFCGNNKTKGSAGKGCPLDWRSGGCCFQQSTCMFISVSFACVCLSFLISRGPDPDYIHRQVQLNWSRHWPILLTLQTIHQHLSFSQETEDTYQAHQKEKGGRAAGVVCQQDNNGSPLSLCTAVG